MKKVELTRTATSPLGSASQLYRTKKNETGSILDQPERGLLELYPAGYTKPSNRDNCSRQDLYKQLYELAVSLGTEEHLYPFEKDSHNITRLHDPRNIHDMNAIHLILDIASIQSPLLFLSGRDMGFIPRRINANIIIRMKLINGIRILKVKCNFHKKFYGAKVVIAYGNTSFNPRIGGSMSLDRFTNILEDQ